MSDKLSAVLAVPDNPDITHSTRKKKWYEWTSNQLILYQAFVKDDEQIPA